MLSVEVMEIVNVFGSLSRLVTVLALLGWWASTRVGGDSC